MSQPLPKAIASASSSPAAAGAFVNPIDGSVAAGGKVVAQLHYQLGFVAALAGGGEVVNIPVNILLDSNGVPVAGQSMYGSDQYSNPVNPGYDLSIYDASGNFLGNIMNVLITGTAPLDITFGLASGSGSGVPVSPNAVITNPSAVQTITGFDLNIAGANLNVTSGNISASGSVVGGNGSRFNLISNNGLASVYADQFTDIQTAINALPTAGGIVYATSPNVNLALGSLNPGTRAITLYLGPLAYTANQITLQTNLHIIGCGSSNQTGSGQTKITSIGSNATNLMVIPQSSNVPAQGLLVQGIRFVGATSNTTQKGLFADCSTLTNSGLWYSNFIDCEFDGFVGNPIHLQGRPDNATAVNQFLTFIGVRAFRATSGAESLRINGGNGQIKFIGCEFDGPGISDSAAPNIFIGQTGGGDTQAPYSIDFDMLTCQGSNLGVQLSGVLGVRFQHSHWENLHGCIQSSLVGTTANYGVGVEFNDFFGTVAVNAGNGFIWKDNSTQTRGIFKNNLILGTPDKIIIGTNIGSIDVQNNPQSNSTPVWSSTNVTLGLGPSATINCQANKSVFINGGSTNITTIVSSLGPGETITFRANGGAVFFTTGGNLNFGTGPVPFVLNTNEQATFVYDDADNLWNLQSWSHGATVVNLSSQSANIVTTTIYPVPTTPNRDYRVQLYATIQRAATVSSTMPTVTIGWTDIDSSAALTFSATPSNPTSNSTTGGTFALLTFLIPAKASTNITYATTGYISSGATAMLYNLKISVEPI